MNENKLRNKEVINKCIKVLRCTNDGNDLTPAELNTVEYLVNYYQKLPKDKVKLALETLEKIKMKEGK